MLLHPQQAVEVALLGLVDLAHNLLHAHHLGVDELQVLGLCVCEQTNEVNLAKQQQRTRSHPQLVGDDLNVAQRVHGALHVRHVLVCRAGGECKQEDLAKSGATFEQAHDLEDAVHSLHGEACVVKNNDQRKVQRKP